MPGWGKISAYHNDVASDVRGVLGKRVTFGVGGNPPRMRAGSEVEWELAPEDMVESETAIRVRREDGNTHRVSVFPLCTSSSVCAGTFWVSWHEAWRKDGPIAYILLNAGWTLFEGLRGSEDKAQVLRVDWDQLPHKGGKQAGHPHWHFDHDLFISSEPAKAPVAPGLVEVAAGDTSGIPRQASMGSVHLAMGAWNPGMDHPECWQRTYEDDCGQLRDWCVKTLRYLKEQIGGV